MKINTASSSGSRTLGGNTVTNPKEDLNGITTRSGTAYQGPTIPTTSFSLPQVVIRETEVTKDMVPPTNNESAKDVQPLVVQVETPILKYEPVVAPIIEPVAAPVSAPKPNPKPSIPYPSRLHDQKLHALILMPKFGPTIKTLLTNKDKLYELARTPLNAYFSADLLKKLPEKLRDPGKFLISCDFPRMDEGLALADLGASINLMPLSVWNKLSLPEMSPTCMTLELADRLISRPVEVVKDVFVKERTFHFPADFVVIDFDADLRVPLILGRSFLKTERDLIDVFKGEPTLRVGKVAITFNLDQTSRYPANYNDMTVNRIDVIDMACEDYSQEVIDFSDMIASGNPTPHYDPIVSTSSLTLTPFGDSNFLLEEVDVFLALEDDATSPEVDQSYFDPEGDILLLEAFLNDDPSLPPPYQGNYLPQDLPPNLEYAILEGDDKLLVIIAKGLSEEEKTALIMVLKSHKQAIAWKLFDIEGINPEFCTHKILMEDDFEPVVQHQRKGGFIVVENEENELILTRLVMGGRVCIDYYQEKTTFTYPYRTFAYRRMPFGLCNAPGTFQRCMMAIFHDMIKKTMEVFMDDFSVFGNSFQTCLSHLEKMLKRCEDTNLCLNKEKSHFMVKDGIVLGQKISKNRIEVNTAKVDVIAKLPHPTAVKGVVVGQRQEKHFRPIHNASKIMTEAELNYTTTEKEMLAVVTSWFANFANYHVGNFVVKGMSSQQKNKFFKDVKHYFWDAPFCLKSVRIKSSGGIYTTIKPLISSRPATMDPLGDIMARTTLPKRCLTPNSIGLLSTVEAKALPTNEARVVCKFLKSLFARFGTPRAIISDRSTHFGNDQFIKVMLKCGVTHRLATPYHPPTSGQVEVSNRGLKRILERTVGENRTSWELNELPDQAYENSLTYKEKTKRIHYSKIKDRVFNVGDRVILFNSRLKIFLRKLRTSWSGPISITHVFPYGTVELSQTNEPNFNVNGHRLKHYFEEDIPKMVVLDLQTFPKDQ
nr:reverse transcriptase domain-containing protein [Tanacetum cinerariifolium]